MVEDGGEWRLAGTRRHRQHHTAAGWIEHDPDELLKNVRALIDDADTVDAIAIANQGESCLAWDARPGKRSRR